MLIRSVEIPGIPVRLRLSSLLGSAITNRPAIVPSSTWRLRKPATAAAKLSSSILESSGWPIRCGGAHPSLDFVHRLPAAPVRPIGYEARRLCCGTCGISFHQPRLLSCRLAWPWKPLATLIPIHGQRGRWSLPNGCITARTLLHRVRAECVHPALRSAHFRTSAATRQRLRVFRAALPGRTLSNQRDARRLTGLYAPRHGPHGLRRLPERRSPPP